MQAYSYVRFSTPDQAKGNSLARQIEASRTWAEANGYELDESMIDAGLSGYHGKHLAATAHLGNFLKRIEAGEIAKGSVLIVEHLDRLGRDDVEDALARFIDIKSHVTIVTLMDGQKYAKGDHWSKLMIAIVSMATANEESAKKAERTRDNWKRVRGTTSALSPSWIRRTDSGFEIDQEKAAIVRRIFADILTQGMDSLARRLNAEGIPTLNGRTLGRTASVWDASSLKAILRSRKALGEQAHGRYVDGKREETGEVTVNAYRAVISEAEWYAAQQAMDARRSMKGDCPAALSGHNVTRVSNLFGKLAICSECQNRMTAGTRGKGVHLYLGCSMAKTGKCSAKKWHRLDAIEAGVISLFGVAAVASGEKAPADPAATLALELADAKAEAARLETLFGKAFEASLMAEPGSLAARAAERIETDHKAKIALVKRLESAVQAKRAEKPASHTWEAVRHLVTAPMSIETRAKVAANLPAIIRQMVFNPDGGFTLRLVDSLPASLPVIPETAVIRHHAKGVYHFAANGLYASVQHGSVGRVLSLDKAA